MWRDESPSCASQPSSMDSQCENSSSHIPLTHPKPPLMTQGQIHPRGNFIGVTKIIEGLAWAVSFPWVSTSTKAELKALAPKKTHFPGSAHLWKPASYVPVTERKLLLPGAQSGSSLIITGWFPEEICHLSKASFQFCLSSLTLDGNSSIFMTHPKGKTHQYHHSFIFFCLISFLIRF